MEEILGTIRKQAMSVKRSCEAMEDELESTKTLYREIIDKSVEVIKLRDNIDNFEYSFAKRAAYELENSCEEFSNGFEKIEKPFLDLAEKVLVLQAKKTLSSSIMTLSQTKDLIYLIDMPISTKWKLIYRASQDGFGAMDFHSRCDYKPNTLVIIKSKNDCIFGGYTEQTWDISGDCKEDENAFLFSLVNNENKDAPVKLPILKFEAEKAICCLSDYGPAFGCSEFNEFDLLIADNSNSNEMSSSHKTQVYSKFGSYFTGSATFQVKDIQVFQKV